MEPEVGPEDILRSGLIAIVLIVIGIVIGTLTMRGWVVALMLAIFVPILTLEASKRIVDSYFPLWAILLILGSMMLGIATVGVFYGGIPLNRAGVGGGYLLSLAFMWFGGIFMSRTLTRPG